jgi:hypothetical protein
MDAESAANQAFAYRRTDPGTWYGACGHPVTATPPSQGIAPMSIRSCLLALTLLLALDVSARAAPMTFNLTQDGCSSGCGNGPFGTVTVSQDSNPNAIDVSVSLAAGYYFRHANDSNHHALMFDLIGNEQVTIGALSSPAFTVASGSSFTGAPFGTFEHAIDCGSAGGATCSSGYSASNPTALSFVITAVSGALNPSSIVANTGIPSVYFSTDVVNDGTCAGCVIGSTGNVAATFTLVGSQQSSVPEPSSVALLGMTLIALSMVRRRAAVSRLTA